MGSRLRPLRFLAIAAVLSCSDSTGISLEGPSFMHALVDGRPFVLGAQDSFVWSENNGSLNLAAVPETLSAASNPAIYLYVRYYQGPGTYALQQLPVPGNFGIGEYAVYDRAGAPIARYQTVGPYTGSIHIIADDSVSGTIVGTFQFSATATYATTGEVHVTAGSFRIHLTP